MWVPRLCIFLLFSAVVFSYKQSDYEVIDREAFVKRPAFCKALDYPANLPNATIVITVLNEEPALIEANVRSILAKTPPELLDSIIIVDDYSEFLPVSPAITKYPRVQLVRTDRPMGVAGARMVGALKGAGEVLVFLDAQMEATEGWLEPLLGYVTTHPRSVAACVIDKIDDATGGYETNPHTIVGLTLESLSFKWITPVKDPGYVIYTPVLLGSAFAIRRDWFDEGGRYDPENRVWGTENIEMAVRVWTCGGEAVVLPCSHVGHYYRSKRKFKSPRFEDQDYPYRNAIRFAEVWMDEHAELYYDYIARWRPREWIEYIRNNPNLQERKLLRKQMKCKPFSFYWNTIMKGVLDLYNVKLYDYDVHNVTLVDTLNYED